jgi:class 3 adenylate cyclase
MTLALIRTIEAQSGRSQLAVYRRSVERERLARFLPAELVEHVAQKPDLLERRTERRVATVLFADSEQAKRSAWKRRSYC